MTRAARHASSVQLSHATVLTMTRYICVTGGVVSSLGKGIAAASLGAILEARGLKVSMVKLDPYINVDPGTMSPFQHGEVFVTDRRHRDRPRSRPLRALRAHDHLAQQQFHDRTHLRARHRQGAPRRLPRRDGAGHPAHHRRDQALHPHGRRRCGRLHGRDRRHGRRHRVAAVPRGDPPAGRRARPQQRAVHAPDADPVHPELRRDQDQADAALGEGAALDRHPAGHPAVPLAEHRCRTSSGARSRCSRTSRSAR